MLLCSWWSLCRPPFSAITQLCLCISHKWVSNYILTLALLVHCRRWLAITTNDTGVRPSADVFFHRVLCCALSEMCLQRKWHSLLKCARILVCNSIHVSDLSMCSHAWLWNCSPAELVDCNWSCSHYYFMGVTQSFYVFVCLHPPVPLLSYSYDNLMQDKLSASNTLKSF